MNIPILHARLKVQVGVNRPQPLDDVDAQALEHLGRMRAVVISPGDPTQKPKRARARAYLPHDLIGTLDKDLHRPPVVVRHPVQEPLKTKGDGTERVKLCREHSWWAGTQRVRGVMVGYLTGCLAVVELLGEKLNPLQHCGLSEEEQAGYNPLILKCSRLLMCFTAGQ